MGELSRLIKEYRRGDMNSYLVIFNRFEPLLNKLQRKSINEDMKSDLILFMFTLLNKIPLEKECLKEDKYIISYICKSLNHKYIYLNKKIRKNNNEISLDKFDYMSEVDTMNNIIFDNLIDKLTDNEKYVMNRKYKFNYSDTEIAREKGVSRQAVHKIHKRAIDKLKSYINLY